MRNLLYILTLIALASCNSGLTVKVSVLDRERFKRLPQFKLQQAEVMYLRVNGNLLTDSYNNWRLKIKKQVRDDVNQSSEISPVDKTPIRKAIEKQIDGAFSAADISLRQGILEYDKIAFAATEQLRVTSAEKAIALFANGEHHLASLFMDLRNENISEGQLPETNLKVQAATVTLLEQDQLLNDPLASLVLHAPRHLWKSYKFDETGAAVPAKKIGSNRFGKTIARTMFGNSDIAVTMEGPGHYTVKGVRLDAAQVIEATFKVLTQSIQFVSAANGLPIRTPSSSPTNDAEPVVEEINQLSSLEHNMEVQQALFDKATLGLLDVILGQQANLRNNTMRPVAIDIIQKFYDAQAKQFNENRTPANSNGQPGGSDGQNADTNTGDDNGDGPGEDDGAGNDNGNGESIGNDEGTGNDNDGGENNNDGTEEGNNADPTPPAQPEEAPAND